MSGMSIHMRPAERDQVRGLSLIELMVSVVIGLFLVLGATTMYVHSRKTADVDDAAARLQENARYAMSVLESDVRMANYWGLTNGPRIQNAAGPTDALWSEIPSTSAANTCVKNFVADTTDYLTGDNNNYSFIDINGNSCSPAPGNAVTSADTLTVRHASTESQPLTGTMIQICSVRQFGTLITNGDTCGPANTSPPTGEIRNLEVHAYYVDQQSDQSATIPSLRMHSLVNGPRIQDMEITEGVEDMQVQFGWNDLDPATPIATRYVNPDSSVLSTPGSQIVAVRIWLLMRGDTPDANYTDTHTYVYGDRDAGNTTSSLTTAGAAGKAYAPNDHYHRVLVSKTIFLRNALTAP